MVSRKARWVWFLGVVALSSARGGFAEGVQVAGRVTFRDQPVAGAEVALWPIRGRYERARQQLAGAPAEPAARATTGRDGRFELVAPAPGMWRARVESKGRVPVEIDLTALLDPVVLPPAKLEASAGFKPKPADVWRQSPSGWVWLAKPDPPVAAAVQGAARPVRVVDTRGEPLAGVVVFAAAEPDVPLGLSDGNGEVVLVLPPAAAILELLNAAGALARYPIEPAREQPAPPVVIRFVPTPELQGRVIDRASRRPLAGVRVWVPGGAGDAVVSDAEGRYAIQGVVEPPRRLAAAVQGFVPSIERVSVGGQTLPTLALVAAGSVAGRVVDREGRAVADAELELSPLPGGEATGGGGVLAGASLESRSSASGEVRIGGLAAGQRYRLDVRKAGFAPAGKDLEPLAPGERRGGLELVLEKGHRAFGKVTDTDDQPIAGALVRLTPVLDEAPVLGRRMRRSLENVEGRVEATTDGKGAFGTSGLQPGHYDLEAQAEGFAPLTVPSVEITAAASEVDLGTVILAAGLRLEGLVRDPKGRPLEGAEIRTVDDNGLPPIPAMMILNSADQPVRATTDAEGRFRLHGLAAGVALGLVVGRDGFITAAIGGIAPPRPRPVEIVLKPASRVTGSVLDDARRPVAGATAMVFPEASGARFSGPPAWARSNAEGRFEIEGVEPGKIRINVRADGFQELGVTGLEVPAGGVLKGLELVMSAGAVVEGTVLDNGGNPLIGATVRVIDPREGELVNRPPQTQTDGDGRYTVTSAVPGPRSVEAVLEGYERGVRDLEVKAGVNRVDFVLGGGVEVSGKVLDSGGGAVPGAKVQLEKRAGFRSSELETTSAADGGFRFASVAAGDYQLSAAKSGLAEVRAAQPLEIRAAPVVGLELVLEAGATLQGEVRGLELEELGRLRLRALGQMRMLEGRVDHEGRYEIAHLGAGEWTILAEVDGSGRSARETVVIEQGVERVERDVVFGQGHFLSGVAVRRGGAPIGGAAVWVIGKSGGMARGETLYDGSFRLEGLESDVYMLELKDFRHGLGHKQEVEVDGDTDVRIEVGIGHVRGSVRDSVEGQGVEGAHIGVRAVGDEGFALVGLGVESDTAGNFDLGEVAAGRWRIAAEKPGYSTVETVVEVAEGEVVDDVELRLVASEGVQLTVGWIAGGAPSSVRVLVLGADGPVVNGSFPTGEGGRVRLSQVPAGRWNLLVQSGESAVAARQIQAPGDVGQISLGPGGRLEVRVSELEGGAVEAKLVVIGVDGAAFVPLDWLSTGQTEIPVVAGRAAVSNLGLGPWTVVVTAADGRSWRGQATIVPGVTTEVRLP